MRGYKIVLLFCFTCFIVHGFAQNFRTAQQQNSRVRLAYAEKWEDLEQDLLSKGIKNDDFDMFIRVFKHEKVLEVWLKSRSVKEFQLFKTYAICASSGAWGPKRKQGDRQVPEGFYNISVFNPYSNFHLSLGISYPNASDRIMGKGNLGGDIMIHGDCVTIGCVPLTDQYIKEVYILAVEARSAGEHNIPVHIFPAKLDDKGIQMLSVKNTQLLDFWRNLKTGYDYFESHKTLPKVTVDKAGRYIFN